MNEHSPPSPSVPAHPTLPVITVEFEDLGEGRCGAYNPKDPADLPLLRADLTVSPDGTPADSDDEGVETHSRCTSLVVGTDPALLEVFRQRLTRDVRTSLSLGEQPRRALERATWWNTEDLTRPEQTDEGQTLPAGTP